MNKARFCSVLSFFVFSASAVISQEALKSVEEEYYDFLSLQGIVERPTLNYRTLSDSVWNFAEKAEKDVSLNSAEFCENDEEVSAAESGVTAEKNGNAKIAQKVAHPWQNNNLGTTFTLVNTASLNANWYLNGIKRGLTARIYGPEWFNSFNTAAPYGQNDGALWQGRGYNTSLTAGVRLEGYGFELTLKPQVSFSQNLEFEIMKSNCDSEYGYFWGYGKNIGVDAPQRFGDRAFWTFDWGDSEIRYSWHTFTVGFGTQSPWIGPAWLNPLLGSNNAASYPKFDIGIRKTKVTIPGINWYFGDIEARIWTGYLSESDYFDNNPDNDHNQISGFSVAYSPSFIPGLSLGATKICLSKWGENFWKYLNPFYSDNDVYGVGEDQKISITAIWQLENAGINIYGEIGIDDKINMPHNSIESYITHIWHTMTYTVGLKKTLNIKPQSFIFGEILFEWNNTEMSQDMQVQWAYNFGMHHQITQGYTNKGQWLGAGTGYGGNNQYLGFKLYYPKGSTLFYISRTNPDNNYLFKESIYDIATGEDGDLHKRTWNCYRGQLAFGIMQFYCVSKSFSTSLGITYIRIVNPLYRQNPMYETWNNFNINVLLKYTL